MKSNQPFVSKSSSSGSKHWVSGALLLLMVLGFVVVGSVFLSNRQALPISIGVVSIDTEISTNDQPVVANTNNNDAVIAPEGNLTVNNTESEASSTQDNSITTVTNNTVTLTVISTERADEIIPPMALNYDPENAIDIPTWELEVPNSQSPITVFLAGAAGCASCGIEAGFLQQIVTELENPDLEVVFVDIYPYAGAETLAWFAGILDATDLTWAMDQNSNFMNTYQVSLDSTLIMDSTGTILYRDDIVSPPEILREQIDLALNQTS